MPFHHKVFVVSEGSHQNQKGKLLPRGKHGSDTIRIELLTASPRSKLKTLT